MENLRFKLAKWRKFSVLMGHNFNLFCKSWWTGRLWLPITNPEDYLFQFMKDCYVPMLCHLIISEQIRLWKANLIGYKPNATHTALHIVI